MAPLRIYAPMARRMMLSMTRHKHTHTGLVTPSLPQRLLTAMLQLFAMLVSSVSSTLQMTRRRLAAECHSDVTPAGLPRETSDTHQETEPAAQHRSPIALMLSSTQSVRPSKHEGALTPVSHTSPSPSVSPAPRAIHLPLPSRWRQAHHRDEGELPPSVRSTGGGGLRALARKTEGVRRGPRSGRIGPVDQFEQRTPERKRGRESHIRTPN
jgi:hypothetical protein